MKQFLLFIPENKLNRPYESCLRMEETTGNEEEGRYYGFSTERIWPLYHITHARPDFSEKNWQTFGEAKSGLANAVHSELPVNNPFLFIKCLHITRKTFKLLTN